MVIFYVEKNQNTLYQIQSAETDIILFVYYIWNIS